MFICTFSVGAQHLGAPKSLRGTIAGDKLGLDKFLSEEEALINARSFGSVPWMYSVFLSHSTPPNAYLRKEGVAIHVQVDRFDCIEMFLDQSTRLRLAVTYKNCTLYSRYQTPEGDQSPVIL